MYVRKLLLGAAFAAMIAEPAVAAQSLQPGYSSFWWTQIDLNLALEATSSGANGFKIGLVDTGVVAGNAELVGRVSSASSCAAVTFKCSNGVTDDNGHGTATAAIAAGSTVTGGWMSGVAPRATIIEEKVLNAQGSGYDADVANGIVKAVDAGALVVNLSLTYTPTAKVVGAINYAASKGAIVVFAGGNSAVPLNGGANSTGYSAAALNRLVFVGSVNSNNQLSSFSNTPGTGGAIAGSVKDSYASLWLMAPGERIVAPGIQYGANAYAYWTGTSMAAPMVTGALALLETTWPVLVRNGTATQIMFQTATNLGAAGIDTTYGNGLLDVGRAFQPIGTLNVTTANGKSMAVSQLSTSVLTGGALGSLSNLSAQLSNYTSFDSYQRNYIVNLSGLIAKQSTTGSAAATTAKPPTVSTYKSPFADGDSYTFGFVNQDSSEPDALSEGPRNTYVEATDSLGNAPPAWYVTYQSGSDMTLTVGRGLSGASAFSGAFWGSGSDEAAQTDALGISGTFLNFAQGGSFMAYGGSIASGTTIAFAASDTLAFEGQGTDALDSAGSDALYQPSAAALSMGFNTRLNGWWSAGLSVAALDEQDGLLGTTYDSSGPLGFGDQHRSVAVDATTSFKLTDNIDLLFDAMFAYTDGASVSEGLISEVSPITARAFGASISDKNVFRGGDRLTFGVKKPLRALSGTASLATTAVDADGYATTSTTKESLTPSGDETDLSLHYATALGLGLDFDGMLEYSNDANNTAGANAVTAAANFRLTF